MLQHLLPPQAPTQPSALPTLPPTHPLAAGATLALEQRAAQIQRRNVSASGRLQQFRLPKGPQAQVASASGRQAATLCDTQL